MHGEARVLHRVALELFDRSDRLKQYLAAIGPGASGEHSHLIDTIRNATLAIESVVFDAFDTTWGHVLDRKSPDHADNLTVLKEALERFSIWFANIHELLVYLPRLPIVSDTWFTLQQPLDVFHQLEKETPSIITGGIFNAFEFDFFDIMKEKLPEIERILTDKFRSDVLQIAICDRTSPLAYPILAHELGHAIDSRRSFSESIAGEFVLDKDTIEYARVRNWCTELFADLFAAHLLGPSPILALISMECCFLPRFRVFWHSETHPATRCRIEVVSRYLEHQYGEDFLRSDREAYETAWEMNLRWNSRPRDRRQIRDAYRLSEDVFHSEFVPQVLERIESLELPDTKLQTESLDRCVKRIATDSPVSAQGLSREILREEINKHRMKRFRSATGREKHFVKLARAFTEKPLDVSTILMAGHVARRDILMSENNDRPEITKRSVREFAATMRRIDELIGSSVVTSNVHKELVSSRSRKRRRAQGTGAWM